MDLGMFILGKMKIDLTFGSVFMLGKESKLLRSVILGPGDAPNEIQERDIKHNQKDKMIGIKIEMFQKDKQIMIDIEGVKIQNKAYAFMLLSNFFIDGMP